VNGYDSFYYDHKHCEVSKPIDAKFWNFTVSDEKGKLIGRGNLIGNKRTAMKYARQFVQWYVQ
jgi:hypothetical protein